MRILVVEDEEKLAADLCQALTKAGYVAEHVADGEEAWFLGDTEDYSAVILDLGLPRMDGLSVLKKWRASAIEVPVLILTARGSWSERVDGIDAGADDYLPKPFQMQELLARLRAIVRRAAGHAGPLVAVGPIILDERQMRISLDGVPLNLSPLEYRATAYLLLNKGRVVSHNELAEHIYGGDTDRDNNTLEVLVGRIRRKLGSGVIETRRGYGYIIADEDGAGANPDEDHDPTGGAQ